MQAAAKKETSQSVVRGKPLHISEVLEVFGRQGCFGLNPARLSRESRAARQSIIKNRGFLFLRHLPHCDWHSRTVGFRRLLAMMKRWNVITEASWRKASGMPVVTAASSTPDVHLRKVRRLAASFTRRGVMEDVSFILFTHGFPDTMTLLDGNHRALALLLAEGAISLRSARFRVIVGASASPCRYHGDDQRWLKRPLAGRPPGRYILDIWNP